VKTFLLEQLCKIISSNHLTLQLPEAYIIAGVNKLSKKLKGKAREYNIHSGLWGFGRL
jgi:hypothetical protein